MRRAATWILLGLPLAAQPPREARIPFYGQELVYRYSGPAAAAPAPLVVLAGGDWDLWLAPVTARGWLLAAAANAAPAPRDTYAKALEAIVADAQKRLGADPSRVYLAGTGPGVAAVFYARGRVPHLWAAAFAAAGDPQPAIDSNRLFAANAELIPMVWAGRPEDEPVRARLRAAKYPFEWRDASQLKLSEALEGLARHSRPAWPPRIDCETGNLAFARCYWLAIAKPDPARRNDVLGYSRVPPGSGASLAEPLRPGDRVLAVGGVKIADERDYARYLDQARDEKPVAIVVQRGKERVRIETRLVLPRREENITARVRAEWSPESRELLILSRGVAEMRVELPAAWVPATLNWNGQEAAQAGAPGCWIVGADSRPCSLPR